MENLNYIPQQQSGFNAFPRFFVFYFWKKMFMEEEEEKEGIYKERERKGKERG